MVRRPGRKPFEQFKKSLSQIGSSSIFSAICTTRSSIVGIPSGRCLPFVLGIQHRFTGCGRYVLFRSSVCSVWTNACRLLSSLRCFRLMPSMPAVRLPGLRSTSSRAAVSQSVRQIRWYRSSNLCSGCPWALRAKLSCVLRISSIPIQDAPFWTSHTQVSLQSLRPFAM